MVAKRRVDPADITAAQSLLGIATRAEVRFIERGRAYDPGTRKMYKDGFAPWQLTRSGAWLCSHRHITLDVTKAGPDFRAVTGSVGQCGDCSKMVRLTVAGEWAAL